jgi:hypothetical protein
MSERSVILAVEDKLSEAVVAKILKDFGVGISQIIGLKGKGYLQQKARSLNQTAKGFPVFMLTDQDSPDLCPARLIQNWIRETQNPGFFLRVAVMEVESWIIADRGGIAEFLSIPVVRIPQDPDSIRQPKEFLVSLARLSKKSSLREEIVPAVGATSKVGPGYNNCISEFVHLRWNIDQAASTSLSLRRTITRLKNFEAT